MDDDDNFIWINLPNNEEIKSLIKEHRTLVDAKKQVKRKYVTAHHLQHHQRKKKPVHVEEAEKISTRKSPRLNKLQGNTDSTVTKRLASAPASARRKLDLHDIPHEDEHMGENDHIEGKEKVQNDEDYVPEPAEEQSSNDDLEILPKRTKQLEKTKFFSGPTTRSRANGAETKDATEKEASSLIHEVPANIELPEAPVGQGSMADFLALQKSQKENAKKAAATENARTTRKVGADFALPDYEDDEDNEAQVVRPKRLRGETRMDKVHTRSFDNKVVIDMNERFQPVFDDDIVTSELSNFLGTITKRCVPLTYANWRHVPDNLKDTMWNYVKQRYIIPEELRGYAMLSIQESWRGRKSRLKRAHYNCYPTDEARLENRPNGIPLATFKSLLEYWGDETVQKRAKKNAESRSKIVDTHTAGPKCFSQLKYKMKEKRPDDGEPSQGRVFVKTCKRRARRKYKTDPSLINYIIEKIKKNIGTSREDIQELIIDGKLHGPSWLIGRSSNSSKISATAPKGTYVQDLTSKIKESLVEEVEAKVSKKVQEEVDAQVNKKLQENLTQMLKKLSETLILGSFVRPSRLTMKMVLL
ncbi:hypothetical protein POM88_027061 [Heracleum sosnowskyi]|uniref:Transposase n=1 Tax=Heracleum sosnowskyi TaxID=360622 RepID=A0AAD8I6Z5_9APIA|nr:hypothetical protein POM88_027061 [Heracleum sosnowskyi]